MKPFQWNPVKNERLKYVRGVGFEEIAQARLIDIREHPGRESQEIMLFEYQSYIWVVPFVRSSEIFFLKTLYRSRKYTRMFERGAL